ncbi:MAG: Threonine dehydrogenase and related Zn-dependent dehydrogenases, partial [uncultured Acetobacteraceae bacterium]
EGAGAVGRGAGARGNQGRSVARPRPGPSVGARRRFGHLARDGAVGAGRARAAEPAGGDARAADGGRVPLPRQVRLRGGGRGGGRAGRAAGPARLLPAPPPGPLRGAGLHVHPRAGRGAGPARRAGRERGNGGEHPVGRPAVGGRAGAGGRRGRGGAAGGGLAGVRAGSRPRGVRPRPVARRRGGGAGAAVLSAGGGAGRARPRSPRVRKSGRVAAGAQPRGLRGPDRGGELVRRPRSVAAARRGVPRAALVLGFVPGRRGGARHARPAFPCGAAGIGAALVGGCALRRAARPRHAVRRTAGETPGVAGGGSRRRVPGRPLL